VLWTQPSWFFSAHEKNERSPMKTILSCLKLDGWRLNPNDTLLVVDSCWCYHASNCYSKLTVSDFRSCGGENVFCISGMHTSNCRDAPHGMYPVMNGAYFLNVLSVLHFVQSTWRMCASNIIEEASIWFSPFPLYSWCMQSRLVIE